MISAWIRKTPNTGDIECGTGLYYPFGKCVDFRDIEVGHDLVVMGGGGIFIDDSIRAVIARWIDGNDKVAFFGAGRNTRGAKWDTDYLPLEFMGRTVNGIRDWWPDGHPELPNYQWVPCASCKHPLFDELRDAEPVERERELWHWEQPHPPEGVLNSAPFETIVRWIAGAEVIRTNSYHGCYWATLLGRGAIHMRLDKCVRASRLRHVPNGKPYPDALRECREACDGFFSFLQKS